MSVAGVEADADINIVEVVTSYLKPGVEADADVNHVEVVT